MTQQHKVNALASQLIVGAGVYATAADFGMTSLAVPSIANHFDTDLPTIQWVVVIQMLTSAAVLLPMGAAGDVIGRKRLFSGGLAVFALGAFLSGIAEDLPLVLAARALQGGGAGAVLGTGWAIAVSAVSTEDRGRIFGFLTGAVAIGMVSGPIFGGLLVDGLGWRSVFFFTTAISVVGMVFAHFRLQEPNTAPGDRVDRSLDWPGMILAGATIVTAILALTSGPRTGWTSPLVIVPGVATAFTLTALVLVERWHPYPMIDVSLFRNRAFSLGSLGMFLSFGSLAVTPIMLPFYLQGVLDYSPRVAGLILAPQMLMLALFGPIGGRIADRLGSRWPTAVGATTMVLAYGIFTRLDIGTSVVFIVIPLMLQGLGDGRVGAGNNSGILSSVELGRMGVATSFVNLARTGGLNVGIAIATIVVTLGITNMGIEPNIGSFREEGGVPDPRLVEGFVQGLSNAYLVGGALVAVAGLTAFLGMPSRSRISGRRETTESLIASVNVATDSASETNTPDRGGGP